MILAALCGGSALDRADTCGYRAARLTPSYFGDRRVPAGRGEKEFGLSRFGAIATGVSPPPGASEGFVRDVIPRAYAARLME